MGDPPETSDRAGDSAVLKSDRWTVERWLAIVNAILVVVGGGLIIWTNAYNHEETAINAQLAMARPQKTDISVHIDDTGQRHGPLHLYAVQYSITSVNNSKRDAYYGYSVLDVFLGTLSTPTSGDGAHALVNAPPPIWTSITQENGAVKWTRVVCTSALAVTAHDVEKRSKPRTDASGFLAKACPPGQANPVEQGGGLTGRFGPGTATAYAPEFLIWAHPGQLLGTSLGFGLNYKTDISDEDVSFQQDISRIPTGRNKTPTTDMPPPVSDSGNG